MKTSLRQPYRQFFGTLANQFRIDIIEALQRGPLSVTQICRQTTYNQSTVSHNLRRLQTCGFVSCRVKGRERIYALNSSIIRPLLGLMHRHMNLYCRHVVGV